MFFSFQWTPSHMRCIKQLGTKSLYDFLYKHPFDHLTFAINISDDLYLKILKVSLNAFINHILEKQVLYHVFLLENVFL